MAATTDRPFNPHGCRVACCGCGTVGLCSEMERCDDCGGDRCARGCYSCGLRARLGDLCRPTGHVCQFCGQGEATFNNDENDGVAEDMTELEECDRCGALMCGGCTVWRDDAHLFTYCANCCDYKCVGCGSALSRDSRYDGSLEEESAEGRPCSWKPPYCAACLPGAAMGFV